MDYATLFFSAVFPNNIILASFLGMCAFISLSRNLRIALGMGIAVTGVTVLTVAANWLIRRWFLVPFDLEFLQTLVFVLTIAAVVQVLESVIDRFFPYLYIGFGIFLPLITVNCAVLGASLFMVTYEYEFLPAMVSAAGTGVGYTMAIVTLGSLRQHLIFSRPPKELGGVGAAMLLAGLMAMAFAGLSGLVAL
jgi:Na+-transporting NADH:ubiquinone oxidoreductase subunit E